MIYGPKSKPCARIERWILRMQPYKFTVRYQPGPKNIADPLSRLVNSKETGNKHSSQADEYVRFVAISATPSAMTTRELEEASADDEELSEVRKCINGKPWDQLAYKQYLGKQNCFYFLQHENLLRAPRGGSKQSQLATQH